MRVTRLSLTALLFFTSLLAPLAAEPRQSKRDRDSRVETEQVELFEAISSGALDVKVIAKDSKGGNVLFENKTSKRLSIKLPDALGAVPVLAQLGNANLFAPNNRGLGANNGMGMNSGANQALGVGLQGGGGNPLMNGGGNRGWGVGNVGPGILGGPGGIFDVEPEKVRKIKLTSVCLEHGKREPNTKIEYRLVPLDSYTSNPATLELIRMLASGEIDQHCAQAAAWHLENGLTWEKLAEKVGVRHFSGQSEPYFLAAELERAKDAIKKCEERAAKRQSTSQASYASTSSASQR